MNSVTHSLWCQGSLNWQRNGHTCARTHIWSRGRGNSCPQRVASRVSDRISHGSFLGSAAIKNSRLVQVTDHRARLDHICASGMS